MSNEWTVVVNLGLTVICLACVGFCLKMLTEYWKDKGKK